MADPDDDNAPQPSPPNHSQNPHPQDPTPRTNPTPFRFKSKRAHSSTSHAHKSHRRSRSDSPSRRHRHHSRSSRPSRPSRSSRSSKHATSAQHHPDPRATPLNENAYTAPLSADAAFRESLFDALADDEGADYWSGVYGQPIAEYARDASVKGELESMDEDAYVAYVRRRMWERSMEGREEAKREQARARREEERAKVQAEGKRKVRGERAAWEGEGEYGYVFDFDGVMDSALRRGKKRKEERRWREAWEGYLRRWEGVKEREGVKDREGTEQEIAYPTLTLSPPFTATTISDFFHNIANLSPDPPPSTGSALPKRPPQQPRLSSTSLPNDEDAKGRLKAILKQERVRWHPDKMQQRLGNRLDEDELKNVTAVFQIVDDLFSKAR